MLTLNKAFGIVNLRYINECKNTKLKKSAHLCKNSSYQCQYKNTCMI